jgi:quercetin dioxygenase-like cupin family protein
MGTSSNEEKGMKITRIYTGADGQSHIEDLPLASHPELSELHTATGIQIRSTPAGHFMDWHPAPRRQYVIVLSGEMEIGLGDGSIHRLGAGDVLLAEDVTGRGHTRQIGGDRARIAATIPLAG